LSWLVCSRSLTFDHTWRALLWSNVKDLLHTNHDKSEYCYENSQLNAVTKFRQCLRQWGH